MIAPLKRWLLLAAALGTISVVTAVIAVASQARRTPGTHSPRVEKIRPGIGIGAVSVGESQAAVQAALGRPERLVVPQYVYRGPVDASITFDYWHRVDAISTTSPRARTSARIGPGTTWSKFRRAYRHSRCFHSPSQHWTHICTLKSRMSSALVETNFLFARRLSVVQIFVSGELPEPAGMH